MRKAIVTRAGRTLSPSMSVATRRIDARPDCEPQRFISSLYRPTHDLRDLWRPAAAGLAVQEPARPQRRCHLRHASQFSNIEESAAARGHIRILVVRTNFLGHVSLTFDVCKIPVITAEASVLHLIFIERH
jgi:hypothetical protein